MGFGLYCFALTNTVDADQEQFGNSCSNPETFFYSASMVQRCVEQRPRRLLILWERATSKQIIGLGWIKCRNRERCKMWRKPREKHAEFWILSWSEKNEWEFAIWANERIAFWAGQRSTVWELPSYSVCLVWDVWATTSDEAGKVVRGQIIKNLVCSRKDFTLYPGDKDSKQGSNIIRFCFRKITLAAVLRWSWS